MAEIDKSMKLVFNEFTRAISEVPLEVYYQTISSDQYSANGFQFNIKQPGTNALLDCDIWMRYVFLIKDTANNYIRDACEASGAGGVGFSNPLRPHRVAFRGGNVAARCLQNLSIQINNTTLNVQPYKYMDILNRIYVSNDMSQHEFSASGGRFDDGSHGQRIYHPTYRPRQTDGTQRFDTGGAVATQNSIAGAANANASTDFRYCNAADWWEPIFRSDNDVAANALGYGLTNNFAACINMRPPWPDDAYWTNKGFTERVQKFRLKLRGEAQYAVGGAETLSVPNAGAGGRFIGTPTGDANSQYYFFEIYERLPIPLFKMYSSDGNYGVIPNITQMQIQGNFLTTMAENMLRGPSGANIGIHWTGVESSTGKLYLRWYTPPVSMAVPRELSIPYPKINTWATNVTLPQMSIAGAHNYTDVPGVAAYNITLEAIPDLLLIYVKYRATSYTFDTPDDCLMELINLSINIDNASGKINQIQSIDLYQKWKKIIKHQDAKIIEYDEWRKYCCVACLQPEDYGCRYGPGYSNQTTLGITCTARDWHANPSISDSVFEPMGGALGAGRDGELIVTSIYNKSRLTIRADGTASQDMTKMAADFNMLQSSLAPAAIPQLV